MSLLIAILSLLWPATAAQALQAITNDVHHGGNRIAFVQACSQLNVAATGTSFTINIGSTGTCTHAGGGGAQNPATNDYVVIYSGYSAAGGAFGCSDSLGNTTGQNSSAATPDQGVCRIFMTTGGADTVTLTNTSGARSVIISLEFSGTSSNPPDASSNFTCGSCAAGTSWTLPNNVTANANDVIVSGGVTSDQNANFTFTAGSGYTIPTGAQASGIGSTHGLAAFLEYQIVTATGTYAPTVTISASTAGVGYTRSFKSQ